MFIRLTKNYLLIALVVMIIGIVTGCNVKDNKNILVDVNSKVSKNSPLPQSTLKENEQTNLYNISLPKGWTAEKLSSKSSSFYFKKDNIIIGGLFVQPYYEQPLMSYLPNHSSVLRQEHPKNFIMETTAIYIEKDRPAVENNPTLTYELHIFIDPKNKKYIYQLFFDLKYVDENTALDIAKEFKLN